MKKTLFYFLSSMMMLAVTACSTGDGEDELPYETEDISGFSTSSSSKDGSSFSGSSEGFAGDSEGAGGETANNENSQAGIVTAGEWSDLNNWPFWSGLMTSNEFSDKSDYWMFYTNNRVAVKVVDGRGNDMAGVSVKLLRKGDKGQTVVWEAVTDNHGQADCWLGLCQKETAKAEQLLVSVAGQVMEGHPDVTDWNEQAEVKVNRYVCGTTPNVSTRADIAFVVDATGSMLDEINFLKNDLEDIINKAASVRSGLTMRTAALFYRDEGDEYLTRFSNFTENLSTTRDFVREQGADGGGDYPEAVHTALERMLQELSWDTTARTRLAFIILDAPAHHQDDVIRSLQQSITTCARQGIRLIPVAASGVDKNTEFMLRFFAIATGGTYTFLTNHSGVGNEHIEATVGDYKVEQLNDLIIRLIGQYTE